MAAHGAAMESRGLDALRQLHTTSGFAAHCLDHAGDAAGCATAAFIDFRDANLSADSASLFEQLQKRADAAKKFFVAGHPTHVFLECARQLELFPAACGTFEGDADLVLVFSNFAREAGAEFARQLPLCFSGELHGLRVEDALQLLKLAAQTLGAPTALPIEDFSNVFSAHAVRSLRHFAEEGGDLENVRDTLIVFANLFFTQQLGACKEQHGAVPALALNRFEQFVLAGYGLQNKELADVAAEHGVSQTTVRLSFVNCAKKLASYYVDRMMKAAVDAAPA